MEELEMIHEHKTGALISFAITAGAFLAKASSGQLQHLETFAYYLGLIFQVQDDILDIVGDPEKLGKPVGSDTANEKSTYPSLLGMDGAIKQKEYYVKQAEKALSQAKQLEEEEAYDEAISEVDQVLDKGLEPSGLKGIKQDLKELKSRLDEKKEEKLAKEKEQQFADNLQGYWAEDAPDVTPGIEIGKVTSEEWMFAILASDVAAYAEIDSLDVDEDNNQINIKTTDGHVVEVTNFDGDKMTVGDTELHKFTKEEMEAKVGDSVSVDEIFDVENIKGMMELNE